MMAYNACDENGDHRTYKMNECFVMMLKTLSPICITVCAQVNYRTCADSKSTLTRSVYKLRKSCRRRDGKFSRKQQGVWYQPTYLRSLYT